MEIMSVVKFWFVLALYLILHCDLIASLPTSSACRPTECPVPEKFNYLVGQEYTFQYEGETSTSTTGAGATIKMSADVTVSVQSTCEMTLKMFNSKMEEVDPQNGRVRMVSDYSWSRALDQHAIRFTFDDGVVGSVCSSDADPIWSVNIKKGILSLFQNTMNRLDVDHFGEELDIHGKCDVNYQWIVSDSKQLSVKKMKDLHACDSRSTFVSPVQSIPYPFQKGPQTLSLLKSRQECVQTVNNKKMIKAMCEETHLLRPFSNGDAGAKTTVKQTMELKNEQSIRNQQTDSGVNVQSNLRFDHDFGPESESSSDRDAIRALTEFAESHEVQKVSGQTPVLFSKLVSELKRLKYSTLWNLYQRAESKCRGIQNPRSCQRYIEDALVSLGTPASISVMKDLIDQGSANEAVISSWMTSLTFIPRPREATLAAAIPLVRDISPPPAQAQLTVSAMAQRFCTQYSGECSEVAPVKQLIQVLTGHLNNDCTSDDQEQLLLTLKAIGNLGELTPSLFNVLKHCVVNERASMEVRVTALQAFRRMPCSHARSDIWWPYRTENYEETMVGWLLTVYKNQEMDTELRIAAYLQAMNCPDVTVIRAVQATLMLEQTNQVGAFVWSHLKNINETSLPSKAKIQGILSSMDLQSKFTPDIRKYSRNLETSVFYDQLNIGGGIESNVIFSPGSYLPKTVNLNLTADILGESINVLELGSRIEGYEYYLQRLFGPGGVVKKEGLQELFNVFQESPERTRRQRRQVDGSREENIKAQGRQLIEEYGQEEIHRRDPLASLYVRIFGQEVSFNRFIGFEELKKAFRENFNPFTYFRQFTEGPSNVGYNISRSMQILDTHCIVATGLGLPLNLTLDGSAVVTIDSVGTFNVGNPFTNGVIEIEGSILPTISIQTTGTMQVDGRVTRAGARVRGTYHTSTALDGKFHMQGNQKIKLHINMPKEEQKIVNMESSVEVFVRDTTVPKEDSNIKKENAALCSGPILERALGIKFCSELTYPNGSMAQHGPYYPLTGPAKFDLTLRKTDPNFRAYIFEYEGTFSEDNTKVHVNFNMPQSQVERTLSFRFTQKSKTIQSSLHVPNHKITVSGKYKNTDYDKRLDITCRHNNNEVFVFYAKFLRDQPNSYRPRLSLSIMGTPLITLEGEVHVKQVEEAVTYSPTLEMTFLNSKFQVSGDHTLEDYLTTSNLVLAYTLQSGPSETVRLSYKDNYIQSGSLEKTSKDINLQFSQFPDFNINLDWEFQIAAGSMETLLEFSHGRRFDEEENKLRIKQIYTQTMSNDQTKVNASIQVTHPVSGIDWFVGCNYAASETLGILSMKAYGSPQNVADLRLYYMRNEWRSYNMSAGLHLELPNKDPIKLRVELREILSDTLYHIVYKMDAKLEWEKRKEFQLQSSWATLYGQYGETTHNLDFNITLPSKSQWHLGLNHKNTPTKWMLGVQVNAGELSLSTSVSHKLVGTKHHFNVRLAAMDVEYMADVVLDFAEGLALDLHIHLDTERDIKLRYRRTDLPNGIEAEGQLKWDANRDSGKQVRMVLLVKDLFQRSPEIKLTLVFPERTIVLDYEGQRIGQHSYGDYNFNNRFSLSWEPERAIEIQTQLRKRNSDVIDLDFTLKTPFENFETMHFIYKHEVTSETFDMEVGLEKVNEKLLSVVMKSELERVRAPWLNRGMYMVAIESVSRSLTQMEFKAEYTMRKGFFKGLSTWEWNHDQVFTAELEGSMKSTPEKFFELNSKGAFLIPSEDVNEIRFNLEGGLSRNYELEGESTLNLDTDKYTMQFKGTSVTSPTTDMRMDVFISTPHWGYEEIVSTARLLMSDGLSVLAESRWPGKAMNLTVIAQAQSFYNFHFLTNFKSPFKMAEVFKIELKNALDFGNSFETSAIAQWSPDKAVGFEGDGKFFSVYNFTLNAKTRTPSEDYNILAVHLLHNLDFDNRLLTTILMGEFSGEKVAINLDASAKRGTNYLYTAQLTAESTDLFDKVYLKTEHRRRSYKYVTEAKAEYGSKLYQFIHEYQKGSGWDMETVIRVKTHLRKFKDFQLRYSLWLEPQDQKQFYAGVAMVRNEETWEISAEAELNSEDIRQRRGGIEWVREGFASLHTPYTVLNHVEVSYTFKGTESKRLRDYSSSLAYTYGDKTIEGDSYFRVINGRWHGWINIKKPFDIIDVAKIDAEIEFGGETGLKHVNVTTNLVTNTIIGNIVCKIYHDYKPGALERTMELQTYWSGLKQIQLHWFRNARQLKIEVDSVALPDRITFQGDLFTSNSEPALKGSLKWGISEVVLTGNYKIENYLPVKFNGTLAIPIKGYELGTVQLHTTEERNGRSLSALLDWNEHKVDIYLRGNYRPGMIEGQINLQTPWQTINDLTCWTKLEYESWEDYFLWELKLKTPYEKLPQLNTEISYRKIDDNSIMYKLAYNTEEYSGTFAGMITKIEKQKYRWKHTNSISWEPLNFSEIEIEITVDDSWWRTQTELKIETSTVELPKVELHAGWNFPETDKPIKIFFNSSLPFEGLETFVMDLTFKLSLSEDNELEYEGDILMRLNDKRIFLESGVQYTIDRGLLSKIKLHTPFKRIQSAEFDVEYSYSQAVTSSLSIAGKVNDKYKFVSNFEIHNLRHIDGKIHLELPFKKYDKVEVEYFHNLASDSYEISSRFKWPEEKYISLLLMHDARNRRGEVSVTTSHLTALPFNSIKFDYNYKIVDDEMFLDFGIQVNRVVIVEILIGWEREETDNSESNYRFVRVNNVLWAFGANFTTMNTKDDLQSKYILDLYDLDFPSSKLHLSLDFLDTVDNFHTVTLKGVTSNREISMENQYYVKDTSFAYQNVVQLTPEYKYLFSVFGEDVSVQHENLYKWRSRFSYPGCQINLVGEHKTTAKVMHSRAMFDIQGEQVEFHVRAEDAAITDELFYVGLIKMAIPQKEKEIILRGKVQSKDNVWMHLKLDLEYDKTEESRLVLESILRNVPVRAQGAPLRRIDGHFKITHPTTNLNVQVDSKLEVMGYMTQLTAISTYTNTRQQRHDAHVSASLDTVWKVLNITVTSPTNSFLDRSMYGHLNVTRPTFDGQHRWWNPRTLSPLSMKAQRTVGGVPEAELEFSVDPNKPTFILDADYIGRSKVDSMGVYMMGGLINPQTFEIKLLHMPQGDDVVADFSAVAHLNHTELFTTYINWRPRLLSHVKDGFIFLMRKGGLAMIETTTSTGSWVGKEVTRASEDICRDIEHRIIDFLQPIKNHFVDMRNDWQEYFERIVAMRDNNDFFIQQIEEILISAFEGIKKSTVVQGVINFMEEQWENLQEKFESFKNIFINYDDTMTRISEWLGEAAEEYLEIYREWKENLSMDAFSFASLLRKVGTSVFTRFRTFMRDYVFKYLQEVRTAIKESLINLAYRVHAFLQPYLYQIYDYIETKAANLIIGIKEFLYNEQNNIIRREYRQFFGPLLDDINTIYRDFSTNDLSENIKKYLGLAYEFLADKYDLLRKVGDVCQMAWRITLNMYYGLLDHPTIDAYVESINKIYYQLAWIIDYTEQHERIHDFFTALWEDGGNMFVRSGKTAHFHALKHKSYFKFMPDEGYLVYEQKLPFTWRKLTEKPTFSSSGYMETLQKFWYDTFGEDKVTETLTAYYTADYMTWIPPFQGHATLSGSQHFRTWDGVMYEFTSAGQFLLGGDLVSADFFFVVSHEATEEGSVRVIYIVVQDNVVAIYPDSKVLVNGESVNLPYAMQSGGVIHTGTMITVTSDDQGFTVECNSATDMCSFDISGWHTGKTAGLLGTYDFEPSTDFTSKTREHKEVDEWALSWSLTPGTVGENQAVSSVGNDTLMDKKCRDLFESPFSQFEFCFQRVPPEHFLQMCRNDLEAGKNPCATAHFYVKTCKMKGKPIKAPTYCTICQLNGEDLQESESKTIEEKEIDRSTDVVLLVENKECNNVVLENGALQKLITSLNNELDNNGIRNNRFALIGFGGDGVYAAPYIFSKNNKLFFRQVEFVNALEEIPIGDGETDIYAALMYASKLPYRPTVSKTFILMLCSECSIGEPYSSGYGDIYHMMVDNGVTLHLLMDIDIDTGKRRHRNKIYGVDKQFVYKKQSRLGSDLEGDSELRGKIRKHPTVGECGGLAEETNGTLFSSKFLNKRVKQVKRFVQVLSKRIRQTATPASCQNCECITDYTKDGNFQCRACEQAGDYINIYDYFEEDFFGTDQEGFNTENTDFNSYYYEYGDMESVDYR